MSEHKCGGACCRRFVLGGNPSPNEIKEKYLAWCYQTRDASSETLSKLSEVSRTLLSSTSRSVRIPIDIHLVYPMLIYLGEHDWDPCDPKKHHAGKKIHHYGCKHFDTKTNLCTIYDIRPMMCKTYPGDNPCLFPGCKIPGNKERLKKLRSPSKVKDAF